MRLVKTILLLILVNYTFGQPGGGGGLKINTFYNDSLQPISIKDTNLNIRVFSLSLDSIGSNVQFELTKSFLETGVRQVNHLIGDEYYFLPPKHIRLFIKYKSDTMLVDLLNIIEENGGGVVDFMDSIVIQEGFYIYDRGQQISIEGEDYHQREKRLYQYIYGLTPSTVKFLTPNQSIIYRKEIDLSFLLLPIPSD